MLPHWSGSFGNCLLRQVICERTPRDQYKIPHPLLEEEYGFTFPSAFLISHNCLTASGLGYLLALCSGKYGSHASSLSDSGAIEKISNTAIQLMANSQSSTWRKEKGRGDFLASKNFPFLKYVCVCVLTEGRRYS